LEFLKAVSDWAVSEYMATSFTGWLEEPRLGFAAGSGSPPSAEMAKTRTPDEVGVVADITHSITGKSTETPSIPNG
jgi:hypothetical protein